MPNDYRITQYIENQRTKCCKKLIIVTEKGGKVTTTCAGCRKKVKVLLKDGSNRVETEAEQRERRNAVPQFTKTTYVTQPASTTQTLM